MKFRKKGQANGIGGLQGFILAVITLSIVLAIGLIVLTEMQDAAKIIQSPLSVSNESVTTSGSSLKQSGELFISASGCRNGSMINFPFSGVGCNISSRGIVTYNLTFGDDGAFIDYSHYDPSSAFNSTKAIIVDLATIPTWIGIIIIMALAFIVLAFFIGKRQ